MDTKNVFNFLVLLCLFPFINAMDLSIQKEHTDQDKAIKQLVAMFNRIDKYKNDHTPRCKSKLVVLGKDNSTLVCIGCSKALFDRACQFTIGRFDSDYHVHIMHLDCFCNLANKTNPCPFCNKDESGVRGGSCDYYEELASAEVSNDYLYQFLWRSIYPLNFVENGPVTDRGFSFKIKQ